MRSGARVLARRAGSPPRRSAAASRTPGTAGDQSREADTLPVAVRSQFPARSLADTPAPPLSLRRSRGWLPLARAEGGAPPSRR